MANNTTNGDSNRRVFDLMNLLTQEEDPFFEPTSTAVAKKPVRKREEPIAEDYGSISEDPRSFIQRKADEIYESGPAGAALAAIADILPGIPFVDIIDPPEQLSDPSSQTARNLLGAVGLVAGMAKTPQAVGRVATNIREPWGYGENLERILGDINRMGYHRRGIVDKAKLVAKSIIKDKPIYGKLDPRVEGMNFGGNVTKKAALDAREYLYRKMFGLKPRAGKNIFVEHADGTVSFNPKSKRARNLMRNVVHDFKHHPVMGGYKRTQVQQMTPVGSANPWRDEIVDYEDIWDFKMNPSDWDFVLKSFTESPKAAVRGTGMAAVRSLVDMITKPVHIKGRVAMNQFGEFSGQRGPDPKVVEDFVRMMATD
jgi:hypothetical protein